MIAIVGGTGPEGSGLALRWARAGESVVIGSRDGERAKVDRRRRLRKRPARWAASKAWRTPSP